MCLNPLTLPNGQKTGCRKCWQCKARKVDDWVGRCIAESRTAKHIHAVILTYGRDEENNKLHPRAVLLTYSDVQKYFKKLRIDGYKFRYFCVGEYGSERGRAHWHLVMFWYSDYPKDIKFNVKKHNQEHWEHGFSYFDDVKALGGVTNAKAVRYVCKYLQKKDTDEVADYDGPHPSKKPPLGHDWFMALAQDYVDHGLAPQTLHYSFPEIVWKGKRKEYYMNGKTGQNFLDEYIRLWLGQKDGHIPASELVEEHQDKMIDNDTQFQRYYEGIKDGAEKRQKYAEYLREIERSKIKDVEAWYQYGPVKARRSDGTKIYRARQAQSGETEPWRSISKDSAKLAKSGT